MALTEIGRAALIAREAMKLHAYKDSVGVWTIGIGHAFGDPKVTPGMVITEAEALEIFARDLRKYEAAVDEGVTVPLADHERDALVSICFNIGIGVPNPRRGQKPGFLGSSFLKKLNAGDRAGCAKAIMSWVKPPEVTTRRQAERDQFLTPYTEASPKARSNDRSPVRTAGISRKATARTAAGSGAAGGPVESPTPAPAVAPRVQTVDPAAGQARLPWWARLLGRKDTPLIERPGLHPSGSTELWDVQNALRDRAYYTKGRLDGLAGPLTQEAVAQARKDNGLGDGGVDSAFLAALPGFPTRPVSAGRFAMPITEAARQRPEVFNPVKWLGAPGLGAIGLGGADGSGLLDKVTATAGKANDVLGSAQSAIGTASSVVAFVVEHRAWFIAGLGVFLFLKAAGWALDGWIKVRRAFF